MSPTEVVEAVAVASVGALMLPFPIARQVDAGSRILENPFISRTRSLTAVQSETADLCLA